MDEGERLVKGPGNDWRNLLFTELRRTGGDPSHLFEILEGIIEQRAWEHLVGEDGRPVGTLRRLIEAPLPVGCGQPVEKILKLLDIEHRYEQADDKWRERMAKLRQDIRAELGSEQLADKPGAPTDNKNAAKNNVDMSTLNMATQGGNSAIYAIRRLQRDNPELAQRVLNGKISANQAAIQEGWRNPSMTVYLTDMEKTAKKLLYLIGPEQIDELILQLDKLRSESNS